MADWRNPHDYDYTEDHNLHDWAWEFIRRSPDYRRDWEAALAVFQEKLKRNPSRYHRYDDLIEEEKFPNVHSDIQDANFAVPRETEKRNQWHLDGFFNPEIPKPHFLKFHSPLFPSMIIGPIKGEMESDMISIEVWPYTLVSLIDIFSPLEPQLEKLRLSAQKARKRLRREQKIPAAVTNVTLLRKKLWKIYLRCLDAHSAGAKRSEAAATILGEGHDAPRSWDEHLKQAKAMADKGYKALILDSGEIS